MVCYTAIKKNKEVLYVLEETDLQDILLAEKSNIQTSVRCVL